MQYRADILFIVSSIFFIRSLCHYNASSDRVTLQKHVDALLSGNPFEEQFRHITFGLRYITSLKHKRIV